MTFAVFPTILPWKSRKGPGSSGLVSAQNCHTCDWISAGVTGPDIASWRFLALRLWIGLSSTSKQGSSAFMLTMESQRGSSGNVSVCDSSSFGSGADGNSETMREVSTRDWRSSERRDGGRHGEDASSSVATEIWRHSSSVNCVSLFEKRGRVGEPSR